ncbi:glycosyltransferase involved in cell wall biosynthesis [Longimicrobium terrae]|uniref:Glycosyltransferase involved in cell wall biosynthesis n=2 Tax=Longimicrobium terrae TaxID=1639882 RepID=A0A841H668_9BACT|nr:glycosyltransferase involved in cell wall biosynthesis [Longimicrobium terrae]MBB6073229.1 glycosyltransferase involved in cell wall biosynthesis [Longimicrobium terrae]
MMHVYAGNLYGGVERMLAVFAAEASTDPRLEQSFALCFEGRLADELREAEAPLDVLGPVRMRRPLTVVRARRALAEVMERRRPDVVVCHSSWTHGIFASVARDRGIPVAFWLHDAVTGRTWADRLARRTRPDAALCTSAFAATTLERLWSGVPSAVVHPPIMHHTVDPLRGTILRGVLGTGLDEVVILQASRMEAWKGHRVLIDALGLMAGSPGWTCWIAGGPQRPAEEVYLEGLRARAEELGIAHRVRFLGQRADVPLLMAAADIVCQPNLQPEPFGITFVEAMQAGRPVVGTAAGGTNEVVVESTGFLIPVDDAAALADALRTLVEDEAVRHRLGAAGPGRARELSDPLRQMERMRAVLAGIVRADGARADAAVADADAARAGG